MGRLIIDSDIARRRPRRVALWVTVLASLLGVAAPALAGPFEEGKAIVSDAKKLATRAAEAEKKFATAAKQDPKNADAHYNLGLLASLRGDFASAERAWTAALGADGGYLAARARLAELQLRNGNEQAGVRVLEEIIEQNRYQPEARNILAARALESKDWEGAIKHARNVLLGDPEHVNAYVNLALAYFHQGLVDQALLIASSALERRPKAAALHNIMGLIHLNKDNSRLATESFLKAVAEDPGQVDAKLNLAAMELSYGDFQSALRRFDEVLKAQPGDPMLILSRAVALRGLKRYEEAEAGYEAALAAETNMPEALYNLCVLHHQYSNKWETAETYCQRYQDRIDKSHLKWGEIRKRLRSIRATIEALRETTPVPTPSPEGQPSTGAGGGGP